jgi:hypothetical protein
MSSAVRTFEIATLGLTLRIALLTAAVSAAGSDAVRTVRILVVIPMAGR